ncbi:hypothetical protein B0H14DRAFT_3143610 [Mycena olivaceomarginata]|nr:hypothetical protein B0H14DRAFT_3143610 [Mycena olivaceomarginata]
MPDLASASPNEGLPELKTGNKNRKMKTLSKYKTKQRRRSAKQFHEEVDSRDPAEKEAGEDIVMSHKPQAEPFPSLWSTGADFIQLDSSALGHLPPALTPGTRHQQRDIARGSRAAMKLPRSGSPRGARGGDAGRKPTTGARRLLGRGARTVRAAQPLERGGRAGRIHRKTIRHAREGGRQVQARWSSTSRKEGHNPGHRRGGLPKEPRGEWSRAEAEGKSIDNLIAPARDNRQTVAQRRSEDPSRGLQACEGHANPRAAQSGRGRGLDRAQNETTSGTWRVVKVRGDEARRDDAQRWRMASRSRSTNTFPQKEHVHAIRRGGRERDVGVRKARPQRIAAETRCFPSLPSTHMAPAALPRSTRLLSQVCLSFLPFHSIPFHPCASHAPHRTARTNASNAKGCRAMIVDKEAGKETRNGRMGWGVGPGRVWWIAHRIGPISELQQSQPRRWRASSASNASREDRDSIATSRLAGPPKGQGQRAREERADRAARVWRYASSNEGYAQVVERKKRLPDEEPFAPARSRSRSIRATGAVSRSASLPLAPLVVVVGTSVRAPASASAPGVATRVVRTVQETWSLRGRRQDGRKSHFV